MNEVDRKSGIGASEAPTACGLSPYQQQVELYLRKIGEAPDIIPTEEMLFGTCIEAGGIRFFSELNSIPVKYPMPTVRHAEHQFILATPDGEISSDEGLEFKSMGYQLAKKVEQFGLAEICPQYVIQAQQQMAVMGWEVVRLVALVERKLREYPIDRNDRLIRLIIDREAVFWDHVQRRIPPDVDFSRPGAMEAVKLLYPEIKSGNVIRLSEAAAEHWAAFEALGKQEKEIKDQREVCKARVLAEVGENYAGVLPDNSKMLRRKTVNRPGYKVDPCDYIDFRAVKYDGSPVLESGSYLPQFDESEFVESENAVQVAGRIDAQLLQAGWLCNHASESGSRYYVHETENQRVRVSDHAPNKKTTEWMARANCCDVRVAPTGAMLMGPKGGVSQISDLFSIGANE